MDVCPCDIHDLQCAKCHLRISSIFDCAQGSDAMAWKGAVPVVVLEVPLPQVGNMCLVGRAACYVPGVVTDNRQAQNIM